MDINEIFKCFENHLNLVRVLDDNEIDGLVSMIPTDFVFKLPKSFYRLPLYRARYKDGRFDTSSIDQFGYIHDASKIKLFRYNKPGEQVLYTSTHPITAIEEVDNSSDSDLFISKWINTQDLNYVVNLNPKMRSSHSGRIIYPFILDKVGQEKASQLERLGTILEWPVKEDDEQKQIVYRLTSSIASKLFETCNAIITTSAKSKSGELNVTFNKNAADSLKLQCLFEYKHSDIKRILAKVSHVGVVNSHNSIEWYNFAVSFSSVKIKRITHIDNGGDVTLKSYDNRRLISRLQGGDSSLECTLVPNIQSGMKDKQVGIIVDNERRMKYYVVFKYDLVP